MIHDAGCMIEYGHWVIMTKAQKSELRAAQGRAASGVVRPLVTLETFSEVLISTARSKIPFIMELGMLVSSTKFKFGKTRC